MPSGQDSSHDYILELNRYKNPSIHDHGAVSQVRSSFYCDRENLARLSRNFNCFMKVNLAI